MAPLGFVGGKYQAQRRRSEQGGAGCLDKPEADEHLDAGRRGAGGRGGSEDADTKQETPVPSVAVRQPPEKDEQRGVDDGISVEDPGHLAQVGYVEVTGDLGQRHIDNEKVEAGEDYARTDDDKHLAGRRRSALVRLTAQYRLGLRRRSSELARGGPRLAHLQCPSVAVASVAGMAMPKTAARTHQFVYRTYSRSQPWAAQIFSGPITQLVR